MTGTTIRSALLAMSLASAGCTASTGGGDTVGALRAAGSGPGAGGVCAYYSGRKGGGRLGIRETFARRACFPSRAACERWLYRVQTEFPTTGLRKGCR